jgi:phosphate-selective porin OprO/OprP
LRPRRNFDPAAGQWGALQVLGRFAVVDVDNDVFSAGLAGLNASPKAQSFTVAVNWYPTAFIKYYATFEHTQFEGTRPSEDVILFRAQLAF